MENSAEVTRLLGDYTIKYGRLAELAQGATSYETHLSIIALMEELIQITHRLHDLLGVEPTGCLILAIINRQGSEDGRELQ